MQFNEKLQNLKKEYETNKKEINNSPEIKNIKDSLQITQLIQDMNNLYPDNYYYNRSYANISSNFDMSNYNNENNLNHFYYKVTNEKYFINNENHLNDKNNINQDDFKKNNDNNNIKYNSYSKDNNNTKDNNSSKVNNIDNLLNSGMSDNDLNQASDGDKKSLKNLFVASQSNISVDQGSMKLKNNKMPTDLKYEKDIVDKATNLYCNSDNTFEVLSFNDNNYFIIYSKYDKIDKNYKIMSHNFNQSNNKDIIIGNHKENIVGFRQIFDENNNKIILISISSKDFNIKAWETEDCKEWNLLVDIKNIYQQNELSSGCLMKYNEGIYIVAANRKIEPIKIYNLKGEILKEIDLNKYIHFIDTYNNKNGTYILLGCGKSCKSYNLDDEDKDNKNMISYYTKDQGFISRIIIHEDEDIIKIIGLDCEKMAIKIWNFNTGVHLCDINLGQPANVSSLCLWDNNYLLVGINNEIGIVDLNNQKLIKSLSTIKKGHITTLKKIMINDRTYLLSHISNGSIILWN